MSPFTRKLIRHVMALLIAGIPGALLAASPAGDVQRSITVHFADLDLHQAADQVKLYHRIRTAADATCEPRLQTGSLLTSPDYSRCVAAAIDQAVAKVALPALSAYYRQQAAFVPQRNAAVARQ
jgi:UrcA family protein